MDKIDILLWLVSTGFFLMIFILYFINEKIQRVEDRLERKIDKLDEKVTTIDRTVYRMEGISKIKNNW